MAHPHAHTMTERHDKAHAMISRTGNKMARGGHADFAEDAKMIKTAIREHEDHEHGGKHTAIKFKSGGPVEGHEARKNLARRARGGSTGKKGTHVNVIVAPQGGMHPPMPMPAAGPAMPPPRPAAPPPPAPAMAQRPPMAPPGAGGGMMPPGARPPGMMKRGGGVQKTSEVGVPSESLLQAKRGGKAEREERKHGGRTMKRDVGGQTGMPGGQTMPMAGPGQPPMSPAQAQAMMAQKQAQANGQPLPTQKRGGRTERKHGGGVEMEAGAGGAEGRIEKMHEYGEGGFKPKEHNGELVKKRAD